MEAVIPELSAWKHESMTKCSDLIAPIVSRGIHAWTVVE